MREEAKEEIFEFKVKTRRKNKKKRLHLTKKRKTN